MGLVDDPLEVEAHSRSSGREVGRDRVAKGLAEHRLFHVKRRCTGKPAGVAGVGARALENAGFDGLVADDTSTTPPRGKQGDGYVRLADLGPGPGD